MSQKNIEFKSHDEKETRSSQHAKNKKSMADQLRGEIRLLVQKQDKARAERWKCFEEYKKLKSQGEEKEAEFEYKSYRTWSDETHRLGEEIRVKLKAVQKYESFKKIEEPKIIDKKK